MISTWKTAKIMSHETLHEYSIQELFALNITLLILAVTSKSIEPNYTKLSLHFMPSTLHSDFQQITLPSCKVGNFLYMFAALTIDNNTHILKGILAMHLPEQLLVFYHQKTRSCVKYF